MNTLLPKRLRGATLAATLAAAACVPSVNAQDSLKASLPSDTLVYVSAPDFQRWWNGFQKSAVYKIWLEEEVQEFLADLIDEVKRQYAGAMQQAKAMHDQGMLPIDPAKIEKIRVNGFTFAITGLRMPGGEQPAQASFAMSVDFGETSSIVAEVLDTLMPMALAQAPEGAVQTSTEEVEGVTLKTLKSPMLSMMMPTLGLMYGFVDGRMVLGTDVKVMRSFVAGLKGKPLESSLATNEAYRYCSQRVDAGAGEFEIYMRPKALIDIGMTALRFASMQEPEIAENVDIDGVARAIDVLGLNGLKAVAFSSGYDGGKGVTKSFAHIPTDERKGLFALSSGKPVDMERLAWIPKSVGSFSIATMGNLEGLYTTVMDAVKAYDPGVAEMVTAEVARMEEGLGFNIQKDAFGAFSDEVITYSMPISGVMATPEMVFMMGCKNNAKTLDVLKKLCKLSDGIVSISEVAGDESLFSVDLTLDDLGGGMDPTGMLDPTIGFKNGYFVFALSRTDVKGAMSRLSGAAENEGDVRSNAAFKPYISMIPQGVDSIAFSDVAGTIDGIYGGLSGIVGILPIPPEVPIDVGLLPSTETITKHLFGSVSWGRSIDKGWISENVGPFGPEIFMGLAVGVVGGVGAASVMTARQASVRRRR